MAPREDRATAPVGYPWRAAAPTRPPAVRGAVQGTPAGAVTRVLAAAVDLGVVAVLVGAGWVAVAAVRFAVRPTRFTFPAPSAAVLLLAGLGVLAAYLAVTWTVLGGTVGDRLLGLRVLSVGGERMHWVQCVLRAALCTVFPIGLLWVLVSRRNRSVQDLLVRTTVVYDGW